MVVLSFLCLPQLFRTENACRTNTLPLPCCVCSTSGHTNTSIRRGLRERPPKQRHYLVPCHLCVSELGKQAGKERSPAGIGSWQMIIGTEPSERCCLHCFRPARPVPARYEPNQMRQPLSTSRKVARRFSPTKLQRGFDADGCPGYQSGAGCHQRPTGWRVKPGRHRALGGDSARAGPGRKRCVSTGFAKRRSFCDGMGKSFLSPSDALV